MADTKIEWADRAWNPVTGCTPISEGCRAKLWNDKTVSWKVGKKNSGRLLDGVEWNQCPGVRV